MSNVEVTENGTAPTIHKPHHNAALPYQSVGDFLSNTNNFKIIESTLREGEQFANAYFDTGMPLLCLYTQAKERDQLT
jgi:homocitrate synthase